MTGNPVTAALLHEVGEVAAGELDVVDTQHGSADYKRDVFAVQATRALSRACWPELELAGGSWGEAA
jgi:CO/xanthine dehydrogenase FAD-binding subunit